jgi:hypothetical protein
MSALFGDGVVHQVVDSLTSGRAEFRCILQPLVAMILGARLGVADAREGRRPFLFRVIKSKHRGDLLKHSLSDVVLPFAIAIAIDAIVQHYVLGYVRPLAAVVVGLLLVWLPYALARALANRVVRRRHLHDAPVG